MAQKTVKDALLEIDENELARIARVANRFLASRPIVTDGSWHHRYRSGRGMDFLDFRDYVPGDDLRMIDWRASARSTNLLVRQFLDDAFSQWYVCLDRSASMGIHGAEKWRLAINLAAAWSYILLQMNARAGLLTFSEKVDAHCPARRGRNQYERTKRALLASAPRRTGGGSRLQACSRELGRHVSVVVISDFLAGDLMQPGLDRLRKLGGRVHALQVLSRREIERGPQAPVTLRDIESGKELFVDEDLEGSERGADQRVKHLQSALADYCRNNDIPLTSCETGQSSKAIIVEHLMRACGRHG